MRILAAVLAALLTACAHTNQQSPFDEPPPRNEVAPVEPRSVALDGLRRREAFDVVLKKLVADGFSIRLHDASAGVIQAERTRTDEELTAYFESRRSKYWNDLGPRAQARAIDRGTFLHLPMEVRRTMLISVVVDEVNATFTPSVEACFLPKMNCKQARGLLSSEFAVFGSLPLVLELESIINQASASPNAGPTEI